MVLLKHYLTTIFRISIQLYEHQNQTIFFATVLAFVRHPVYCTIFQCQKVCFTLFTSFDYLLNHFALLLSVSSRRCGACAAPSAEHARPQASSSIRTMEETIQIPNQDYATFENKNKKAKEQELTTIKNEYRGFEYICIYNIAKDNRIWRRNDAINNCQKSLIGNMSRM